jgi:hypothetical protein
MLIPMLHAAEGFCDLLYIDGSTKSIVAAAAAI